MNTSDDWLLASISIKFIVSNNSAIEKLHKVILDNHVHLIYSLPLGEYRGLIPFLDLLLRTVVTFSFDWNHLSLLLLSSSKWFLPYNNVTYIISICSIESKGDTNIYVQYSCVKFSISIYLNLEITLLCRLKINNFLRLLFYF